MAGGVGAWALSTMLVNAVLCLRSGAGTPGGPRPYLVAVVGIAGLSTVLAVLAAIRVARTPHVELLRSLWPAGTGGALRLRDGVDDVE